MPAKHPQVDRNFNDLSQRFKRNIYDSPKGLLRLAVLKRDFALLPKAPSREVLDVGAGQGQFGLWLAEQGHKVTLTDVSETMLTQAQQNAVGLSCRHKPKFALCDLWCLGEAVGCQQFEVVTCHAVLEWLENPMAAIDHLWRCVVPGGYLSLLFYNVHGLVFKNLLRSNYKKVLAGDVKGQKGSLTPINPLAPNDVIAHMARLQGRLLCHSGVRVFHDYILDAVDQQRDPESVMALELTLSQQDPYRGLGRYVHIIVQKPE